MAAHVTSVLADRPAAGGHDIEVAARVLRTEAEGVAAAAALLDVRFVQTIDLLARVTGRIVVTGMGKSGHVARKIAATLASTGAPAQFVHPAEASGAHELYLMTDDLRAEIARLEKAGVACAPVEELRWGALTRLRLPGGGLLGLYQPRHPTAI